MVATELCYFRNSDVLEGRATVTEVVHRDVADSLVVRLDRTVFYPKGGGQPSDIGSISNENFHMHVTNVSHTSGSAECGDGVDHVGSVVRGTVKVGDAVAMRVDPKIRMLHNRLHSAGHVIDAALVVMKVTSLKSKKAYHYPEGPYLEFDGTFMGAKEDFIAKLQEQCNDLVKQNLAVHIDFSTDDAHDFQCQRQMRIANIISIACGGTHVSTLGEIGGVDIRKVDSKKGITRIRYQIRDVDTQCA